MNPKINNIAWKGQCVLVKEEKVWHSRQCQEPVPKHFDIQRQWKISEIHRIQEVHGKRSVSTVTKFDHLPSRALWWIKQSFLIYLFFIEEVCCQSGYTFPKLADIKFWTWTFSCSQKTYFRVQAPISAIESLYLSCTRIVHLVKTLLMETRTCSSFFSTPNFQNNIQKNILLPEQYGQILTRNISTVTWLNWDQSYVCLVPSLAFSFFTTYFFPASHFHPRQLLKT